MTKALPDLDEEVQFPHFTVEETGLERLAQGLRITVEPFFLSFFFVSFIDI